ncbi:Zinc finger protein 449 [Frankliniella fusca]|uniref:Zinc finger protein 449 n=1 Tax=Frankliniella fusca TaxID=407009 RepID=A0AAE1LDJ8_9NEOP|nr:Zinc finger protein 449 [Frankliniella fusca]
MTEPKDVVLSVTIVSYCSLGGKHGFDVWDADATLTDADAQALGLDAAAPVPPCPECGAQGFRTHSGLAKHRRAMHIVALDERADRPHACPTCGSRFKRAEHLSRHVLLHTGELPYACSHCPNRFRRRDHLLLHERRHISGR